MDNLLAEIEGLKARWMTGADTTGAGPESWQGLDPLAQLALAGQFLRTATQPTAAETTQRAELPMLSEPPLPEALRPLLRRALESKEAEPQQVVTLLAGRGHCVNPLDWMPKRSDTGLPSLYGPWLDWLDGDTGQEATLSAETWDAQPPHSRYSDLEEMHRTTPEAARALIAEVAPTVAADQRLRLLESLRHALTEADAPLLESFLKDRSSKVQALVKTQLARLGRLSAEDDAEAMAEVPDFLEVQRAGILSRRKVVTGRMLKNDAQRRRRRDILGRLSLTQVAKALDLSADAFIAQWDFGEANDEVLTITATSGTDAQVEELAQRSIAAGVLTPYPLMDRLPADRRKGLGQSLLSKDDAQLSATRQWLPAPNGTLPLSALPTKLVQELTKGLTGDQNHVATGTLTYLSLLLDQPSAAQLLTHLTQSGLLAVDPCLTLLRLNAELETP